VKSHAALTAVNSKSHDLSSTILLHHLRRASIIWRSPRPNLQLPQPAPTSVATRGQNYSGSLQRRPGRDRNVASPLPQSRQITIRQGPPDFNRSTSAHSKSIVLRPKRFRTLSPSILIITAESTDPYPLVRRIGGPFVTSRHKTIGAVGRMALGRDVWKKPCAQ